MKKTLRKIICVAMMTAMAIGLGAPAFAGSATCDPSYYNASAYGIYAILKPNGGIVLSSYVVFGINEKEAYGYDECAVWLTKYTTDFLYGTVTVGGRGTLTWG